MKTAIYIEDGAVQLVLTPENDFEKNALGAFEDKPTKTTILIGGFYDCRGGWTRQRPVSEKFANHNMGWSRDEMRNEERSLIVRVDGNSDTENVKQSGDDAGAK